MDVPHPIANMGLNKYQLIAAHKSRTNFYNKVCETFEDLSNEEMTQMDLGTNELSLKNFLSDMQAREAKQGKKLELLNHQFEVSAR